MHTLCDYTNEIMWNCAYSPSSITCVSLTRLNTDSLHPPNTTSKTFVGLITSDDKEW